MVGVDVKVLKHELFWRNYVFFFFVFFLFFVVNVLLSSAVHHRSTKLVTGGLVKRLYEEVAWSFMILYGTVQNARREREIYPRGVSCFDPRCHAACWFHVISVDFAPSIFDPSVFIFNQSRPSEPIGQIGSINKFMYLI